MIIDCRNKACDCRESSLKIQYIMREENWKCLFIISIIPISYQFLLKLSSTCLLSDEIRNFLNSDVKFFLFHGSILGPTLLPTIH